MTGRSIVDSLTAMSGVYGSFLCNADGKDIVSAVPADFTTDILESLAERGVQLFKTARKSVPEAYELRLDAEQVTILIHSVTEGLSFTFINHPDRDAAQILRPHILELCRQFKPTQKFVPTSFSAPFSTGMDLIPRTRPAQLDRSNPLNAEVIKKPENPEEKAPEITVEEGRYTEEQKIGEGSTSEVYRAFDTKLKKEIALKRFKAQVAKKAQSNYLTELQLASKVQHHGVVTLFDAGTDVNSNFVVMELIKGVHLEKFGHQDMADLNSFSEFAVQTLEGLQSTHESGLLHLDIKPSNIMISTGASGRNHATLIDFGRAVLQKGIDGAPEPVGKGLHGTIYCTSPEYLNEQPLDQRSDLYSLGCVFYWLLSGKNPFDGYTSLQMMAAHVDHLVVPLQDAVPELPADIASWVMDLISADPKARPDSAQSALTSFLERNRGENIHRLES